jgi:phosphoglycerate dehydrogenase-like enzyme
MPHVAGSTEEGLAGIAAVVAENVGRLVRGEELLYRVA